MSSIPLMLQLIDDCEPDWYTPYDFGFGIQPHLIATTRRPSARRQPTLEDLIDYTLPLKLLQAQQQLARRGTEGDDTKLATIGKDGFKVRMNVEQFKPAELNVKVVDNTIVVEGKHEEREDEHGYIQRHFVRRYTLPKGYEADKVESSLSSDGLLTVSVPKPQAIEDKSKERVVQIQQTGVDHRQSIKDKQQSPPESAAKEKKSPAA